MAPLLSLIAGPHTQRKDAENTQRHFARPLCREDLDGSGIARISQTWRKRGMISERRCYPILSGRSASSPRQYDRRSVRARTSSFASSYPSMPSHQFPHRSLPNWSKSWQNLQPTRNGTIGERPVAHPAWMSFYLFPHHDDPSIKPIQGCLLSKSISCLLHTAPYSTTLSARIIQISHYCHLQDLPLSVHQDLSATRPARGRGDQGKFSLCVSASQLLALAQLSIIAGSCL